MMKVLDLFCGCGGLSSGLSLAELDGEKFEVVAGLDFHQPSIDTFKLNHPTAKAFCEDIRTADVHGILKSIGAVDVIVGGPSCQGFSTHGKRLADDPRNFLYRYFMKFVEALKPKWVLMENVTGLLRYHNGAFRDNIVEDFLSMGYVVSFAQLQAADYGVPQTRKRVFFVANRRGIPFFFPRPTHRPAVTPGESLLTGINVGPVLRDYVTVRDAIGDLPWIGLGCDRAEMPTKWACRPYAPYQSWIRGNASRLTLHYGLQVPEENYSRIVNIPQGGDWLDIPARLMPPRMKRILPKDATTLYYRLRWDRPAYTITTVYRNVSSGAFTHPDEDRALTHREAARIQSFPDSFQFVDSSIGKQIGNAVPPLLAAVLGYSILAHEKVARRRKSSKASIENDVRALEPFYPVPEGNAVKTISQSVLKDLTGYSPPLVDDQWREMAQFLHALDLQVHSQINLRGVVNGLMHAAQRKCNLLSVPNIYADKATMVRLVDYWSRTDELPKLVELVRHSIRFRSKNEVVSEVGGERKTTQRRRLRPSSAHHFATVLYRMDVRTSCTMAMPISGGTNA